MKPINPKHLLSFLEFENERAPGLRYSTVSCLLESGKPYEILVDRVNGESTPMTWNDFVEFLESACKYSTELILGGGPGESFSVADHARVEYNCRLLEDGADYSKNLILFLVPSVNPLSPEKAGMN